MSAGSDYHAAFEEGAAANEQGQAETANPYQMGDQACERRGWADGFASAQVMREEWESESHWRARNFTGTAA